MGYYKNKNGQLELVAGGTNFAESPIGSIIPFGGTSEVVPSGWFLCDGRAISRTEYSVLFDIIGTNFGEGDGSTTFNIPDLRGEFLRGAGTNSHSGQGDGKTVGTHQDATEIQGSIVENEAHRIVFGYASTGNLPTINNFDKFNLRNISGVTYYTKEADVEGAEFVNYLGVRPTNTSVNYIIKAKIVSIPTDFMSKVDEVVEESMSDYQSREFETFPDNNCNYFAEGIHTYKVYATTQNNPCGMTGTITSYAWNTEGNFWKIVQVCYSGASAVNNLWVRSAVSSDNTSTWTWYNWNKILNDKETARKFDVTIDATSNPINDIKTIVNQLVSMSTKTTTYCGSIYRASSGGVQGCFGNYDISVYVVDSGEYADNTHVNGTLTFGMGGMSNVENTYSVSCSVDVVNGGTIYWNIQPLAIEEGNIRYKVLPTNTDLNTITDEGMYSLYVENASNSHSPRIGWLQLIVIKMNNDSKFQNQILYTNTECFRRYNGNNAWSAWEQDVFQHDIIVNSPSELLANGYDSIVYALNHADWSFLTSHGSETASGHFQLGGYWFGMYTANHIGSYCIVVNGVACWSGIPIRFSAYHDPTTLAWTVRCDETVTINAQISSDANGNLPIFNLLPTNDVEIISLRGTDVNSNYIPSRDSSGYWWCQIFTWTGTKVSGSIQANIELRYRRL